LIGLIKSTTNLLAKLKCLMLG